MHQGPRDDAVSDTGTTRKVAPVHGNIDPNTDKTYRLQNQPPVSDGHDADFLLPPAHFQIPQEHHNLSLDDEPDINLTKLDRKYFTSSFC